MTKNETFKILNLIEKVYPLVTLKSETILRWMAKSGPMDYNMVFKNLSQHLRTNPYPPTLKDIITKTNNEGTYYEWLDEYSLRTSKL